MGSETWSEASVKEAGQYFALTLTADENGRINWSAQTHWIGFSDQRKGWEIREPSLVHPTNMLRLWTGVGQPFLVVNSPVDLHVFLRAGGNALVEKSLAEEYLPDVIKPAECAPGAPDGWRVSESLPAQAKRRAPSKTLRMDVINRDDRRCRICGRRPDDYVDVDLHVHHIRPFGRPYGGLTEKANLITLCKTCHDGLLPHFDPSLFDYLEDKSLGTPVERLRTELVNGISRYRQKVQQILAEEQEAIAHQDADRTS